MHPYTDTRLLPKIDLENIKENLNNDYDYEKNIIGHHDHAIAGGGDS